MKNAMGESLGIHHRGSKKSVLFYTTDCGEDSASLTAEQRSVSLTALHTNSPRMAQLETLEAKMASIEVSLSTTPRRKKSGSLSGMMNQSTTSIHSNKSRDHNKELDSLRLALRDKENIIQTLKGQLCNTLTSRLALRNGAPPLTEADKKGTEDRLERLKRETDNKRLGIKNLKLALERLDITDNIDVRIQQAELEYKLGREELELLTLREESRSLKTALELAENQEKEKNDTVYSCLTTGTQITIHAIEISADPKSPRFGAGPRDAFPGLYVDWALEDSGLCKGDRIIEVNGKSVVGAGRNDLARLLAVAPDSAQIVVIRKGESLAALRTLRSDNLRLTHRIGYLEEQVRDLLVPSRNEISVLDPVKNLHPPSPVQVFQKGPQVTTLVAEISDLDSRYRSRQKTQGSYQSLPKSAGSLDGSRSQLQRRRGQSSKMDYVFDSEPTFYRLQDSQYRKTRPAPPKKPLRLSLHRATSLQSVESAPPGVLQEFGNKKPTKRNHKGDPPSSTAQHDNRTSRTPSRAESCQSALRWPHINSVPVEKWY